MVNGLLVGRPGGMRAHATMTIPLPPELASAGLDAVGYLP
jgi:hypothetical protein